MNQSIELGHKTAVGCLLVSLYCLIQVKFLTNKSLWILCSMVHDEWAKIIWLPNPYRMGHTKNQNIMQTLLRTSYEMPIRNERPLANLYGWLERSRSLISDSASDSLRLSLLIWLRNFTKILTKIDGPGWQLSMRPTRFRLWFFNSLDIVFIYRKLGSSLAQLNDSEVIAIISRTNGKLFKMTASRIDKIKAYHFSVMLSSVYVRIMWAWHTWSQNKVKRFNEAF